MFNTNSKINNNLAIQCPRLRKPSYGMVVPEDCTLSRKGYGAQCAFACNQGFKLIGPTMRLVPRVFDSDL